MAPGSLLRAPFKQHVRLRECLLSLKVTVLTKSLNEMWNEYTPVDQDRLRQGTVFWKNQY